MKLIEEVEANPHKLKKAVADEQQIPPAMLSNILKKREKYKNNFTPETTCLRNETERVSMERLMLSCWNGSRD